jgi:hypothetical protein
MTRLDYELLSDELPELKLPAWEALTLNEQSRALKYDRDTLIARRAAQVLCADYVDDRGIPHSAFAQGRV